MLSNFFRVFYVGHISYQSKTIAQNYKNRLVPECFYSFFLKHFTNFKENLSAMCMYIYKSQKVGEIVQSELVHFRSWVGYYIFLFPSFCPFLSWFLSFIYLIFMVKKKQRLNTTPQWRTVKCTWETESWRNRLNGWELLQPLSIHCVWEKHHGQYGIVLRVCRVICEAVLCSCGLGW